MHVRQWKRCSCGSCCRWIRLRGCRGLCCCPCPSPAADASGAADPRPVPPAFALPPRPGQVRSWEAVSHQPNAVDRFPAVPHSRNAPLSLPPAPCSSTTPPPSPMTTNYATRLILPVLPPQDPDLRRRRCHRQHGRCVVQHATHLCRRPPVGPPLSRGAARIQHR